MHLRILLPFGVFVDVEAVQRIVVMTTAGSVGLLPQRLDCAAAIVPGILEYETAADGVSYAALDAGVMIKTGADVRISVRRAFAGGGLDQLHAQLEREFLTQTSAEQQARAVLAKLESGFLHRFSEMRHE
jgi:F-type H+-transporting ATPase subunit epsilon